MESPDRIRLENLLRLARHLATEITAVSRELPASEDFGMRLALAHAFGIVDQVTEMVGVQRGAFPGALGVTARDGLASD